MGQMNIKRGDVVAILERNTYLRFFEVVDFCSTDIQGREWQENNIECINFGDIVEHIPKDEIQVCERCGTIIYEGIYCDVCYGDLFGG